MKIEYVQKIRKRRRDLAEILEHSPTAAHLSFFKTLFPGGGGLLPYKGLMGMCHWMGSHYHNRIDYTFSDFWG